MKIYYVESRHRWFLVKARNKRLAKSDGVKEFGRGKVRNVRIATEAEIKEFCNIKGAIGEAEE